MVDYVVTQRMPSRMPARAREASLLRNLDWVLLATVVALVGYGLWAIDGITKLDVAGDPDYYVKRQAAYALIGSIGLIGAVLIDPQLYRRHSRIVYGGMIAMLLLVPVIGVEVRNTRRWIELGAFQFQPSEFGKLLVILSLAAFLADRGKRVAEGRTMLAATGLALVPMILVFLQPDLGTAVAYAAALWATLFVAGTRWVHLSALLGVAALASVVVLWAAPAAGIHLLADYQRDRLTGFLNPSENPQGSTYNITQSTTAVGAGGLDGRGVSGATQTNLNYLPEHHTDFVFASLAEQRGFFGVSILLLLYLLLIWRAIKVITYATDAYTATVAGGIAFVFLVQIFINVGMTIGMAPITGIPLPFVSSGGSSMVVNLASVGVLQAICARRR
ncbi:MAG: rod shape-determining protein RodA [Actinobacteria bacterium]|nr:rod shape-determining protein RodA [Actinomycetota bacterium]